MAVKTSNIYGRITVSDEAARENAFCTASKRYGEVELVSRRLADSIASFFYE